jgi:hypothetical protein
LGARANFPMQTKTYRVDEQVQGRVGDGCEIIGIVLLTGLEVVSMSAVFDGEIGCSWDLVYILRVTHVVKNLSSRARGRTPKVKSLE